MYGFDFEMDLMIVVDMEGTLGDALVFRVFLDVPDPDSAEFDSDKLDEFNQRVVDAIDETLADDEKGAVVRLHDTMKLFRIVDGIFKRVSIVTRVSVDTEQASLLFKRKAKQ